MSARLRVTVTEARGGCDARLRPSTCDVFIALGSSLVVYPAAALPALAKHSGAGIIIIDRKETPLDDVADLVLRGEIGRILPALAGMAGRTDATRG